MHLVNVRDIVDEVIKSNSKSIEEYKAGNEKVPKFLMGQCMKKLKGKADPTLVNRIISDELNKI